MAHRLQKSFQEMKEIDIELIKYPEKSPNEGARRTKMMVLFYRWLFLVCIGLLSLSYINMEVNGYALLETLAIAAIYNFFVTLYTLKHKEKVNKASSMIMYFDIVVLTVISYLCGGLDSDVYLFIFFILGYCGIFHDALYTLKLGIFSAVFYAVSCIFQAGGELDIMRLVIRVLLLVLGAFGVSRVNYEVKKYDDLRKKEFRLARTDKLTGLANRHYFDQKLKEEVQYADETNSALNILMFDLDNFKSFNDTYGHMSGDKLLSLFADIIKQCIRKSDIPVRYGGEEFMILIRDLDIFIARNIGERIRMQLEKQRIYVGNGENKKKVSVSCGIAQYPYHSKNIKQVIEYADQALYYAKENGKNAVVVYGETDQQNN